MLGSVKGFNVLVNILELYHLLTFLELVHLALNHLLLISFHSDYA